ncbi:MAG: diguanylate cyclase, partial [Planctomycetota bacterium]
MILPTDFFLTLFERMPGPMYVMRVPERIFEKVNLAMAELMGGVQADIEGKKASDFIDPGEWDGIVAEVHAERRPGRTVTYDFNCKTLQGRVLPLEVSVMNLPSPYDNFDIGIVRDLSNVSELEKTISTQKAKINAAMMANSRLWAITDKIRAAYIAMEKLAQAKNVDDLLEDAHDLLLKSDGLDFKAAIVYLREGDWLRVAKGTSGTKARAINLKGNGRLERFFNTNDTKTDIKPGEIVFSLRAEGANIGLLRVIEHEGVSQETEAVKHMREVIVKTLSNTMSLMIEKIRLYRQVEEQSTQDALTKVFNRRHFDAKLEEEIERVGRSRRPMTLILLDIDHFKAIN